MGEKKGKERKKKGPGDSEGSGFGKITGPLMVWRR